LGIGDWGLGVGDWWLGIGVQAQLTDYGRAGTYREGSGRRHVEVHMFNVARFYSKGRAQRSGPRWFALPDERVPRCALIEAIEALRECFDLLF
jgi:hypothetical protein